jgi:hypothetical protein
VPWAGFNHHNSFDGSLRPKLFEPTCPAGNIVDALDRRHH